MTFAENASSRSDPVKGYAGQVPYRVDALSTPIQVQRVIDGDTIKLASGEKVRYIGIDTPEMRRRGVGGGLKSVSLNGWGNVPIVIGCEIGIGSLTQGGNV